MKNIVWGYYFFYSFLPIWASWLKQSLTEDGTSYSALWYMLLLLASNLQIRHLIWLYVSRLEKFVLVSLLIQKAVSFTLCFFLIILLTPLLLPAKICSYSEVALRLLASWFLHVLCSTVKFVQQVVLWLLLFILVLYLYH